MTAQPPITDAASAIEEVAVSYGWDQEPLDRLRLMMWALFHYYVTRLPHDG